MHLGGSAVKIYIQETNIETDRCVIRIRMEDEGPVINEKYFERMLDDQYDYNVNEKSNCSWRKRIFGLFGG